MQVVVFERSRSFSAVSLRKTPLSAEEQKEFAQLQRLNSNCDELYGWVLLRVSSKIRGRWVPFLTNVFWTTI